MVEARQNRFGFGYSLCSETTTVVEDEEEQQKHQEYLENSYASGNPLSKRAKKIFNLLSFKRKKILELSFSRLEIPKQNSEIPKQNSGIPNQNSGIPKLTSETPNENSGISKQNSEIPKQHSGIPKQNSGVPKQNLGIIKQKNSEIPTQNSGIPKRVAMENITNKSKVNLIEENSKVAKFPIEANRLSLTWINFCQKKRQDQKISLRNVWSDKAVRVSLHIREDKHKSFSFNQSSVECDCR